MDRRVVLTEHAKAEARRRGISEAAVMEVADTPQQRILVRLGREVRQSRVVDPVSGKLHLVRVVVDSSDDSDVIVTVYRTSKPRKYWREQ